MTDGSRGGSDIATSTANAGLVATVRRVATERTTVLALTTAATLFRLVYGLAVADPGSGPDSPTYHQAAVAMAHTGLFSTAPSVPYWPVGYSWFLAIFYRAFGDGSRAFVVVQVLLLGIATWSAYRLVRATIGLRVAVLTAVLICISPALNGAVVLRMYEVPLLAGMTIGADLLWTGFHAAGRRRTWLLVAAGLVLGLFATMQPKVLVPLVLMIGFAAWWLPDAGRRRIACAALALVALLVGPALMIERNVYLGDGFGVSSNLGSTMLVGAGYASHSIEDCPTPSPTFERDRKIVRCVLAHKLSHPFESLEVGAYNELALWSPMVGPLRYRGSWFHAFDPRRPIPSRIKYNATFLRVDKVVSHGWILLTVGLVLGGLWLAIRDRSTRRGAIWLSIPLLSFVAMHAVIAGDPRFRLPIAPFYTAFIAIALLALADRFRARRSAGGQPAT